jgi:hypothetical protein
VGGEGTAKEVLDALAAGWTETFKKPRSGSVAEAREGASAPAHFSPSDEPVADVTRLNPIRAAARGLSDLRSATLFIIPTITFSDRFQRIPADLPLYTGFTDYRPQHGAGELNWPTTSAVLSDPHLAQLPSPRNGRDLGHWAGDCRLRAGDAAEPADR